MLDCGLNKNVNRHFHVFKSVHWGAEVELFHVMAKLLRASCADDTILQDFGGGEVCGTCCEFHQDGQ